MSAIIFDEEIKQFSVVEDQYLYSDDEAEARKARRNRRLKIAAGVAGAAAIAGGTLYGLNRLGRSKANQAALKAITDAGKGDKKGRTAKESINNLTAHMNDQLQKNKDKKVKNLIKKGVSPEEALKRAEASMQDKMKKVAKTAEKIVNTRRVEKAKLGRGQQMTARPADWISKFKEAKKSNKNLTSAEWLKMHNFYSQY